MKKNRRPKGLDIVYEDRDLIVVNKDAGLLTMSYHRDQFETAEWLLTDYLRKGAARSRLCAYLVHRLDRETSGLLVFAKTEKAQQTLKDNWTSVEKEYRAVVHGNLAEKSGIISGYLAEDDNQFVYVCGQTKGRWAQTQYEVIRENEQYSEIKVNLLTGRKNQIRVHFSHQGNPIVGDRKYGLKKKGVRFERMALQAHKLAFDHPYSGKRMEFEAPVPKFFDQLMKQGRR